MKPYKVEGEGQICRKCNIPTMVKKRTKAPHNRNFYYTQWDYCLKCKTVYFNERYKSTDWQENERVEQHLFDISREV